MANTKAVAPAVGHVYADRDPRRAGRRVKVVLLLRPVRKATCENVKTKKRTNIGFDVLAARFRKVGR